MRLSRRAEPLADRLQVGQQLAGVEAVGQRVDHRHPHVRGELGQPLVAGGTEDDGGHVPGDDPARVQQRLAAAEVGGLGVHDDRVAAQLGDAGLERQPGAQADLVEEDRHRPRPVERPVREPVGLHRRGEVEHLGLLGR
nr:hypothetical protein GCM10020092_030230 [Actinoplanes digitatis]